ncbi:MAG: hypothetical protein QM401_04125 [Bacillota bacterium]|nr:hypothetical protein [Bacillota bacterium]
MQNIKITLVVEGLEGIAKAVDNLAGAIQAQEALVVPVGTEPADPNFIPKEDKPKTEKKPAAAKPAKQTESELPEISIEQIREQFMVLARAGKREKLKALLADFDVENVSGLEDLGPNELGAVFERLEDM